MERRRRRDLVPVNLNGRRGAASHWRSPLQVAVLSLILALPVLALAATIGAASPEAAGWPCWRSATPREPCLTKTTTNLDEHGSINLNQQERRP